jgi:methionyl-tRNA formyltransferase
MKIFFITQEEPFFMPKIIQRICDNLGKEDTIVGITILKPYHKNKNYLKWMQERAIVYKYRELFFLGLLFSYVKMHMMLSGIFPLQNVFSVRNICHSENIPVIDAADINSTDYQNVIRRLDIDIIISLSATRIFKKALIDLPKKECVNVHGTLLPRHRGVMGSWWALAAGDVYTGVTVHRIIEKLDAGDIILQEKIPIGKEDTQFSLATKTKKMSADLILRMLELLRVGEITTSEMDVNSGNINTFPTKEQATNFKKSTRRILTFRDVTTVLRHWQHQEDGFLTSNGLH